MQNPPTLPQSCLPNEGAPSLLRVGGVSVSICIFLDDGRPRPVGSKGYQIKFLLPPPHRPSLKPTKVCSRTIRFAERFEPPLNNGVVLGDWFKELFSNLFTVPKLNRGIRSILHLKSLNKYLLVQKFCMTSTWSIVACR